MTMAEYYQHRFNLPKGATEIFLVRHGETQPYRPSEPFPMKDGHGDPVLHPRGIAQAKAVSAHLCNFDFQALYITPLQRTAQTAAPLAARLELHPHEEPDLREVFLGEWEGGIHRMKGAEGDPLFLKALGEGEWGHIPGAETTAKLQARVSAALHKIAARHPDQRIVAVVHGGVIAAALAVAAQAKPFTFTGAENGSISRLIVAETYMQMVSFNETGHLR